MQHVGAEASTAFGHMQWVLSVSFGVKLRCSCVCRACDNQGASIVSSLYEQGRAEFLYSFLPVGMLGVACPSQEYTEARSVVDSAAVLKCAHASWI